MDGPARRDRRQELEAYAELTELNRDLSDSAATALERRERKLAASQEARGFARLRGQIRLRQDADQLIGRQRIDHRVDIEVTRLKASTKLIEGTGRARQGHESKSDQGADRPGHGRASQESKAPGGRCAESLPVEAQLPGHLPVDLGDPHTHDTVLLEWTAKNPAAAALLSYLRSEPAKRVIQEFGYGR